MWLRFAVGCDNANSDDGDELLNMHVLDGRRRDCRPLSIK